MIIELLMFIVFCVVYMGYRIFTTEEISVFYLAAGSVVAVLILMWFIGFIGAARVRRKARKTEQSQ